MREIKFRAKRIDMDRWVYGQYFTTPLTDENSGTKPDAGWFFLTGETRHCIVQNGVAFVIDLKTLGQYTGLKDRNGEEIYEGDVFKENKSVGEIKYEGARFFVDWKVIKDFWSDSLKHHAEHGEVIGNIYENGELLDS